MKCSCGREFVFLRKVDGISDMQFLAAVRGASASDTYYFTLPQLHAEACRRMKRYVKFPFYAGITCIAAAIIIVLMIMYSGLPDSFLNFAGLLSLPGVGLCIFAIYESAKKPPTFETWCNYVKRWKLKHGADGLEKYIDQPALHEPPPKWPEADLYDYGFEKLIIVQRDVLVDWLVLNNLHAGQRALIVAENGYPRYLLKRARKTLTANPHLPVYVLHDPTPDGDGMVERVRNSPLFELGNREIIDLGLRVEDCSRMKGMSKIGADPTERDIPLDTLRYATLAGGVTVALASGVTLSDMLEQEAEAARKQGGTDGASDGEAHYGFG